MNQLTIDGTEEFIPPKINIQTFLESTLDTHPELLEPQNHGLLMMEYGVFSKALKKDLEGGSALDAILWLLKQSPLVERRCRQFRADAL